jgi:hypothetical protein
MRRCFYPSTAKGKTISCYGGFCQVGDAVIRSLVFGSGITSFVVYYLAKVLQWYQIGLLAQWQGA